MAHILSTPASLGNCQWANYHPQPQSPLLSLPCEIRLEIYKHLLVLPYDHIQIKRVHLVAHRRLGPPLLHPAILRTCRQIQSEAEPLLYTRNTFTAHATLLTGMPSLPPTQGSVTHARVAGLIRRWRLDVRLDADPRYTAAVVAAAFSGCDLLEVECWQAMYGVADPGEVLGTFVGVRGVKRCVVRGSVGKDWIAALERSMMRKGAGARVDGAVCEDEDDEWELEKREMFGGGTQYELWQHGNR